MMLWCFLFSQDTTSPSDLVVVRSATDDGAAVVGDVLHP